MSPRLVYTVCYVCVVVFMCVQHSTTASALSNTAGVIDSLKLVVQIIARTWGGFTFCESLKSLAHNFFCSFNFYNSRLHSAQAAYISHIILQLLQNVSFAYANQLVAYVKFFLARTCPQKLGRGPVTHVQIPICAVSKVFVLE